MGSGRRRRLLLAGVGPGLLVAATGVGAGDLATASIAGSKFGLTLLWAVPVGAFFKFVLNEGLARWQLATGLTLLEGVVRRLGRPAAVFFLAYLLIWSFAVGRALVSACGITAHALVPVFADPVAGKIAFGAGHSLLGVVLVLAGGYRLFEKVMSAGIAVMFGAVVVTAVRVGPELRGTLAGLMTPAIPAEPGGLTWAVALLGGVGGTVTLLCYGYWILEEGRTGPEKIGLCRLDLASGYAMTALFGVAMVIVGSTVQVHGGGSSLLVDLGASLGEQFGPLGRTLFLAGAWAAVASSLLGVWQSVPYLFADLCRMLAGRPEPTVDVGDRPYRVFLVVLGGLSIAGLFSSFVAVQRVYAVCGALFIPMLALALLLLNGGGRWVGAEHRNRLATNVALVAAIGVFVLFGYLQLRR